MNLTQHHLDDLSGPDAGGIVVGWMTKLALTAAVVGLLGFDGISVGVAHFSTADDASNAVQAASQSYELQHNLQNAYNAAEAAINSHESIKTTNFAILPDGTTTLTLTNTVKTLVFFRTSLTKGFAVVTVTASGKYTGS